MNIHLQNLINTLTELKTASIISKPDNIERIMKKYDMLFLGSKFNAVYSIELYHCINAIFNFKITLEELNALIPTACNILNMSFAEMVSIDYIGKPNSVMNYKITLWK
ncbi:hypothetical protein [Candidatus Clostridium helianthi]|uniref:Uncharacterized protein n=1 Tax=Candidatus Clostridium helianthi TaxID=3381660 RepID=A0ABW8S168_9CLOT